METYLDQAPCLYFASADDGTLVEVNQTLCTALGFEKQELIGNRAETIFTIPSKIFQQTHFFPLLKLHGHAGEIFITLRKKDGTSLPLLINAERKSFDGAWRSVYVGIIVNQRQKFEEELIAAKRAAEKALNENTALIEAKEQLQKHSENLDRQMRLTRLQNEELRQFNRVATHDMLEPLRKLSMLSNMLIEDHERTDQKVLAKKMSRVTTQMAEILNGLQRYVWLNETPPRILSIDLLELIELVKEEVKTEYPLIDFAVHTGEPRKFAADPEQMRLLFYQLFTNAVRFRKDNRVKVFISTEVLQLNQFRDVEGKYKYVDFLRVTLRDEGVGFDPEYKSQAFELFKKLHPQSGRGVGLSLCKKIIDNHNGIISIDGRRGEDCIVTFYIPLKIADNDGIDIDASINHHKYPHE